ncbi:MAG: peptidoglycan-binding protein [Ilumatobacteraceae bacterium]
MRKPPLKALVIGVVATCFVSIAAPVQAEDGLLPNAIVVSGRGYGHGRGMSQYGSYGWATSYGWQWQQILDFYYGGPTGNVVAPLPDPNQEMSVVLTGSDMTRVSTIYANSTAVVADAGNAIFVQDPAPGRTWVSLVAREVANRVYRVWGSMERKCATTDNPAAEGFTQIADVADVASFTTTTGADPAAPAETQIGLCEPRTNGRFKIRYYRGEVRAVNNARGENRTINVVPMESYLRGVVPRESPAEWGNAAGGAGMNALRAQAVAARSYAATENRYVNLARTCDSQDCQVYGGAGVREALNDGFSSLEHPLTDQAIAETASVAIITPQGQPARTEFTSSNGGRTAGGTFPAKDDAGDRASDPVNSLLVWTRVISAAQLQAKYPQIGTLTQVVTNHDGLGAEFNGYATSVDIVGTAATVSVSGWTFKSSFSLPAPWFDTSSIAGATIDAAPVGSMLFVGDSVGESISAEFNGIVRPAYPNVNYQALSNRCMVGPSCVAAASGKPDALSIIDSLTPEQYPNIVMVQLGYNDDPNTFQSDVDQVVNSLTARGVQRIIFVNLSTRRASRNYPLSNAVLANAANSYPNVTVLDWNAASSAPTQSRWFRDDVHLTTTGRAEFALFLRRELDSLRANGVITVGNATVVPLGVPLARGDRGENVKQLQTALNSYLALPKKKRIFTDGIFGKGTAAAVSKVETMNALPVDGVADDAVLALLGIDPTTVKLSRGTKHSTVATAQTALARVLKVKVRADGIYGSGTTRLVKRFQKSVGLKQSGAIDRTTWIALLTASAQR